MWFSLHHSLSVNLMADSIFYSNKVCLRWLKIEQRLVELDIAVKTSLNLKRPSPDRFELFRHDYIFLDRFRQGFNMCKVRLNLIRQV